MSNVIHSREMDRLAAEFERDVVETFDVDQSDIDLEVAKAEGPGRTLVTFRARWVV